MATENKATKVVTGKVRLSYEHIWEPSSMNNDGDDKTKKYSASLIIDKSDKATLKAIRAAIEAAKEEGKTKWGGKIPKNLKEPLRDGDAEREDEAYEGAFFVNATSKTKPGIVDKNVKPILDASEVYSGCYVRASINFYAFDKNGNRGVAAGLNNIQKVADGEPLSGRGSAEDDFESVDDEDDDLV